MAQTALALGGNFRNIAFRRCADWKLRCVLLGMGQVDRDLDPDLMCNNRSDVFALLVLTLKLSSL